MVFSPYMSHVTLRVRVAHTRLEISLGDIMRDADRGRIGPKWFALQDKEGNATGGNLCMQLNVQLLASSPHKYNSPSFPLP